MEKRFVYWALGEKVGRLPMCFLEWRLMLLLLIGMEN